MNKICLLFVAMLLLFSNLRAQRDIIVSVGENYNVYQGEEVIVKINKSIIYKDLTDITSVSLNGDDYYCNFLDYLSDASWKPIQKSEANPKFDFINNILSFKIRGSLMNIRNLINLNANITYNKKTNNGHGNNNQTSVNISISFSINLIEHNLVIKRIEQLPYSCGARTNIIMEKFGTGINNLLFSSNLTGYTDWQKSSTFIFKGADANKNIIFYVRDTRNGNETVEKTQIIHFQTAQIGISENIVAPHCGDVTGEINASIKGGWRYLVFDNVKDFVEIDERSILGKGAFTMEGDIMIEKDKLSNDPDIGLFGIDNVLEFGFQSSSLSCWMFSDKGEVDLTTQTSIKYPNDGLWHNVALRYDGIIVQILVDGNVINEKKEESFFLVDQNNANMKFRIGNGVWNPNLNSFLGALSRLSFWERALTNDELSNLRMNPPTGKEPGLLAAYTMHERNETALIGVKGSEGRISGVEWSDKSTYIWAKKDINGVFKTIPNTTNILKNLSIGEYKVNVSYETGDCGIITKEKFFTLEDNKDLKVKILASLDNQYCEGNEISLKSETEVTTLGAQVAYSNTDMKYYWQLKNDLLYPDNQYHDISNSANLPNLKLELGINNFKLRVTSGSCDVATNIITNKVETVVVAKIKTNPIKRL